METIPEGKDFSFPKQEEKILQLWKSLDAFATQLKRTEGKPEYIFYDGPPFATGLPHYGHILAGTIKDIVTRFWTAVGYHVTRRFGWDTHGLPIEYEVDQMLEIKNRDDVVHKIGIDKYNEYCRSIVMKYSKEWEKVVNRMGRWIDFKNDYKTMDPKYMESVWWVFKQLHEKGLVYRGFKVMPYSTKCNTPLSNFEANQNYQDVDDPAVMVSFPLHSDPDDAALVAWTTTPWTLPSNVALCVNANFNYAKVRNKATGAVLIVAESRLTQLPNFKESSSSHKTVSNEQTSNSTVAQGKGKAKHSGKKVSSKSTQENGSENITSSNYEILQLLKGSDLAGKKYKPLFEYFVELSDVAFKVVADDYVTDDSGTGVVHCAPAFGEDDYRVCLLANIIQKGGDLPDPVDSNGCFTQKVPDFAGLHVKDADKKIIAALKKNGRLVNVGQINHSYPFCWRSDTPLIYKAVPSWFVAVESFKDRLLQVTSDTYWVPDYVKEKRFHNWLENARDWAISRSRFWGTPLPIWTSEDGKEIVVIGSVEELEQLSGHKVTDLHRHFIDKITIPSKNGGVLHRVEDVFDCWFESGAMPYAYIHYPFENVELFEKNFPGHFVAEGLDQTRGWFYTLMVLSTALFDKPAFKNLICNGLVLAEDGKKMAKRLRNYPPPMEVVDKFGADALRLYLINSPVVRAETLKFKEDGVHAVVKDVFLPWYNAYRFLVQNALRLDSEGLKPFTLLDQKQVQESTNILDQWINSSSQSLVTFVRQEMGAYRLYTVVPYLLKFIDNLTNIYVRFNRKRLKGRTGEDDCRVALSTLFNVLLTTCKAMAPFTPFFAEVLYQNLRKALGEEAEESVHYCSFPEVEGKTDERIERSVARMMTVIDRARNIREKQNKPLKTPLRKMVVVHPDIEFLDDIAGKLGDYVKEEMNVTSIETCNDLLQYASLRAEPNFSLLGKRLGKAMGSVANGVRSMKQAEIIDFEKSGTVIVCGQTLVVDEIKIVRDFKIPEGAEKEDVAADVDGDVLVMLDLRADTNLVELGVAREIVNRVQKLRKKAGLEPTDAVEFFIKPTASDDDDVKLHQVLESQASFIHDTLGSALLPHEKLPSNAVVLASEKYSKVAGQSFCVTIVRTMFQFCDDALVETCGEDAEWVKVVVLSRDYMRLKLQLQLNKQFNVEVNGRGSYKITLGHHFYLSVADKLMKMKKHY